MSVSKESQFSAPPLFTSIGKSEELCHSLLMQFQFN